MDEMPRRQRLHHVAPPWVKAGAMFFITVNCAERGRSQLNQPAIFDPLVVALENYMQEGHWWPRLFLAMPDHWHALLSFPPTGRMEKILRDWKRFTARQTGVVWQDGFFDHRLRSAESL